MQINKRVQVTMQEFVKICDELRNQRETVERDLHKKVDVITWIKARLGIAMSIHTVDQALQATGIVLTKPKRPSGQSQINRYGNNMRTISAAVLHLYKSLGVEPHQSLVDLYNRCQYGATDEQTTQEEAKPQESNGVPLKSVYVDPKTIPVVTPNSKPNQPR